ncbi:ATP-binding cassette domain-containing protein [Galbibacter orientalis]|uniref:ATP-binding cassette domain-containing protein n=1 Tax=Galbibacter orientalis TaxID=453852 RepID=UPI00308065EB
MPESKTAFIELSNANLTIKNHLILEAINLEIHKGNSLAITGNSGSGKTSLANLIQMKKTPSSGVVRNPFKTIFVSQQDHFSEIAGMASTYYSKRYEFHEYENQLTVYQYLERLNKKERFVEGSLEEVSLFKTFNITYLFEKSLLQLSNGERKRLQLVTACLQDPEVLIMDQPYIGLDVKSRGNLSDFLKSISDKGIMIILICDVSEIPSFIANAIVLEQGRIVQQGIPSEIKITEAQQLKLDNSIEVDALLQESSNYFKVIVEMKDVNVSMSGKSILQNVDWTIKQGECWALLGHNGAGKSTLLSLITADNPQGYRNHLILFDRKRGSGESIWDIKQHIGFLSPELHLYFMRGKGIANSVPGITTTEETYSTLSCSDVIISGFKDEIGTVSIPTKHQEEVASKWLDLVKLTHLKNTLFVNASLGEQRVLLLLRALVKSPSLLILDEPCQGMDRNQIQYFKILLDYICASKHITMIYVSHREEEIPNSVTKILRLEKGKTV